MALSPLGHAVLGEVTCLALCWRLVRRDGVALGFTSHDRPLLIAGLRHEAAPGMTPSAVEQTESLDVDAMDVTGALTADAITATDLLAGRWDGALARLFLVDWRDPDGPVNVLAEGHVGEISFGLGPDAGFSAALRGPTAALAVAVNATCSPECRAELGDARCRVAIRGRERLRTVSMVSQAGPIIADIAVPDHVEGRLRVLDGPRAGLERRIVGHDGDVLILDEPLGLAPGDRVRIVEGCDKRFATCQERFGNAANFRGEPHVPGGDVLLHYGAP